MSRADGREQQPLVIAVPMKEFAGWGGGIDFIRIILQGLLHDRGHRIIVLIPRPTAVKRLRKGLGAVLSALKDLARGKVGWSLEPAFRSERVRDAIADFLPEIEVRIYPDHRRGLDSVLRAVRADVAIPCFRPLPPPSPVPWVGYIYDFQHRHFPQLFTEAERAGRDAAFARMLDRAAVVICNSEAVRIDAERFHPGSAGKILVLPFAPTPYRAWFDQDPAQARRRHAVPERYFIVCNQFWIHKDHPTAIRAFAAFLERGGDPETALVCTGSVQDYRDPSYAGTIRALIAELGLAGKVHLLGHLSKNDQIALLRGAIAVLQPTWFEGGRGGGAVADALVLGVPVLLSDIAVNREIVHEGCRFFPKADPAALATLMLELGVAAPVRPGQAELLQRAEAGIALLSGCLEEAIRRARQ